MTQESDTELLTRAKELLATIQYANLATATTDGAPWNSPVFAPWDQELSFYWSSWREAEHSKNIRANHQVFLTLYDTTRARGTNNLRCLYLTAKAFELDDEEQVSRAVNLLYPGEDGISPEMFLGDSVKRIYMAIPERAWLNCASEREVNPQTVKMRVELSLKKLQKLCTEQSGT